MRIHFRLAGLSACSRVMRCVGHTMKIIIPGILIFAVLAMRITRYFDLAKWQTSIGLIAFAGLLYFINIFLIRYYIRKRTPEFANDDMWEMTAGLGIVPKWVSMIGLLSISVLITAVIPWIIELIKHIL